MEKYICKRNGEVVPFEKEKIKNAVLKALEETNAVYYRAYPDKVANTVYDKVGSSTTVEEVQDLVEEELMRAHPKTAKAYILYREKQKEKWEHGWEMTDLERDIYESKYRFNGESFQDFVKRVSGNDRKIQKRIRDKQFIPAGRILSGRGLDKHGIKVSLSNCYALPSVEDSIESIFESAKQMARTYSYGGGCGMNLSKLRPKGSQVNNAAKTTSGAVSFMDLYSLTTELIGQSGRRGALMLCMDSSHPDIEEFIRVKRNLSKVNYANISVLAGNDFMEAVDKKGRYDLSFTVKDTEEVIRKSINARTLFREIAYGAWNYAEPGLLFWDKIKNWHLLSEDPAYEIVSPNPCGEQPLAAHSACCLSAINLGEFVINPFTKDARFNANEFLKAVREGVIYLNNLLDEGIPLHPLKEQQEQATKFREIGLGVAGLADMFIKLGVRYGSEDSLRLIDNIFHQMLNMALITSANLAKEYGPAEGYSDKVLDSPFFKANAQPSTVALVKKYGLRNTRLLTIAPTGSTATMLGASGGAEPLFMISYKRRTQSINDGTDTEYTVFSKVVKDLMVAQGIKDEKDLPDYVVSSQTIDPIDRVEVQGRLQRYIDSAISSTVNLPKETTQEQVEDLLIYAWKAGCKGITVFRDESARLGILTSDEPKVEEVKKCSECGGELHKEGGCDVCQDCGFSP